jgi:hypothetical protein
MACSRPAPTLRIRVLLWHGSPVLLIALIRRILLNVALTALLLQVSLMHVLLLVYRGIRLDIRVRTRLVAVQTTQTSAPSIAAATLRRVIDKRFR